MGRMRKAGTLPLLVLLAACATPGGQPARGPDAAAASPAGIKRTAWGDPDLRGMWPVDSVAQTPRQRPVHFGTRDSLTDEEYAAAMKVAQDGLSLGDRQDKVGILGMGHWAERGLPLRQASLIVAPANGRYPELTEEGKRRAAAEKTSWNNTTFDWMDDFGIFDRCITRGMPSSMLPGNYNSGIQILQSPGLVAIRLEMIHEVRLIHLDGRAAPPPAVTDPLGYSRGHWEGDALVIETTNFTPGMTNGPSPNSAQMTVTERLTPAGPDTIRYEAWIADPVMMTEPYKIDFPWTRNPEYRFFEYACHEGNYSIRDYIKATGTRFAAERAGKWEAGAEFLPRAP